jgi:hypothetical protein
MTSSLIIRYNELDFDSQSEVVIRESIFALRRQQAAFLQLVKGCEIVCNVFAWMEFVPFGVGLVWALPNFGVGLVCAPPMERRHMVYRLAVSDLLSGSACGLQPG